MTPELWLTYANYGLGDKCYLMQVPTPGKGKGKTDLPHRGDEGFSAEGAVLHGAHFRIWGFLSLEAAGFGVRRTATSGNGMRAKAPPSKARERKERRARVRRGGKTDGKSGKGTTGRTADGRLICYAYNNEGCDGNCGMVHCCQVRGCYGAHPTWKHWQEYFAKLGDENKTD